MRQKILDLLHRFANYSSVEDLKEIYDELKKIAVCNMMDIPEDLRDMLFSTIEKIGQFFEGEDDGETK